MREFKCGGCGTSLKMSLREISAANRIVCKGCGALLKNRTGGCTTKTVETKTEPKPSSQLSREELVAFRDRILKLMKTMPGTRLEYIDEDGCLEEGYLG